MNKVLIAIIGHVDAENAVSVSLVPTLQGPLHVRVKLSSGGVASGSTIVADFPLYAGPGGTLTVEESDELGYSGWIPDDTTEQPLVDEIFFVGGEQEDLFDNQTDIPSYAFGGDGDDVLLGGSSTDWLRGDDGDDEVRGRAGNDVLEGRYGNNTLIGGDGDDTLEIVAANANTGDTDTLCGGAGSDHLIGHNFSNNELAAAFGEGTPDDDQDTLESYENTLLGTRYSYTESEDVLFRNGSPLGAQDYVSSDVINCN
jgi:Ca2+-binding RTX toxin-like protein